MKKFITIALAIAVLFSFAACQQATYDGKVETMSAKINEGVYLVGETLTADNFTFTGYTNIGAEVEIPASDVTMTSNDDTIVTDGKTVVVADNSVSFTYKKNAAAQATASFGGEAVTAIEVTAMSAQTVYKLPDGKTAINQDDVDEATKANTVTFTAEYDGGSKQMTLGVEDYAAFVTANTGVTPTGITPTIQTARIESVELLATEGYNTVYYAYNGEPSDAEVAYAAYTAGEWTTKGIYVVAHYQGGYDVLIGSDDANLKFKAAGEDATLSSGTIDLTMLRSSDTNVRISATYDTIGVTADFDEDAGSVTLDVDKDILDASSVKVAVAANATIEAKDYSAEDAEFDDSSIFTFTAERVSGTAIASGDFGVTWTNDPDSVGEDDDYYTFEKLNLEKATVNRPVTLTISGRFEGVEFSGIEVVVDVVAAE